MHIIPTIGAMEILLQQLPLLQVELISLPLQVLMDVPLLGKNQLPSMLCRFQILLLMALLLSAAAVQLFLLCQAPTIVMFGATMRPLNLSPLTPQETTPLLLPTLTLAAAPPRLQFMQIAVCLSISLQAILLLLLQLLIGLNQVAISVTPSESNCIMQATGRATPSRQTRITLSLH